MKKKKNQQQHLYTLSSSSSSSISFTKTQTTTHYYFLLFGFLFLSCLPSLSSALVHLRGKSFSFPFIDAPARFAVGVNSSGSCGALYISDPLDACSSLNNNINFEVVEKEKWVSFVLIERGNCAFEDKVRNAQQSGFHAAIVYDNRQKKNLVSKGPLESELDHHVKPSRQRPTTERLLPHEHGQKIQTSKHRPTTNKTLSLELGQRKQHLRQRPYTDRPPPQQHTQRKLGEGTEVNSNIPPHPKQQNNIFDRIVQNKIQLQLSTILEVEDEIVRKENSIAAIYRLLSQALPRC
ncbi:receptor-like protein [Thalictrum thalictroides]|uniref:Receptor-like protein n=1 Tax=Thalictrum thalictroides TaxID=46969 RepID=A0A7J6W5A7_THATH|nr:receptor-like protein [Thalictrum thalictroides]